MASKGCVYWIRLPEHTDILTQGYVGVSVSGSELRFRRHIKCAENGSKLIVHVAIRKYCDKIIIEDVVFADPEYCLELEFKLTRTRVPRWQSTRML